MEGWLDFVHHRRGFFFFFFFSFDVKRHLCEGGIGPAVVAIFEDECSRSFLYNTGRPMNESMCSLPTDCTQVWHVQLCCTDVGTEHASMSFILQLVWW